MAEKKTKEIKAHLAQSDASAVVKRRAPRSRKREKEIEGTRIDLNTKFESTEDISAPDQLGEVLVQKGLIDRFQLFNALNESYKTGCSLSEALVSLKYLDTETLRNYLAK